MLPNEAPAYRTAGRHPGLEDHEHGLLRSARPGGILVRGPAISIRTHAVSRERHRLSGVRRLVPFTQRAGDRLRGVGCDLAAVQAAQGSLDDVPENDGSGLGARLEVDLDGKTPSLPQT